MITLLLLQGSGVVSALHKITHHTHTQTLASCDHATSGEGTEREDAPAPEREDDDCSICLGLAGLHLVPVIDATRVCEMPEFEVVCIAPIWVPCSRFATGEHPARAPPVC